MVKNRAKRKNDDSFYYCLLRATRLYIPLYWLVGLLVSWLVPILLCFCSLWHRCSCPNALTKILPLPTCMRLGQLCIRPCLFSSSVMNTSLYWAASVGLLVGQSVLVPVSQSVKLYLIAHLSVYQSICPSIYLFICISSFLSICWSVCLSVCLSVHLSVYPKHFLFLSFFSF